jgi:uncharacterized protein
MRALRELLFAPPAKTIAERQLRDAERELLRYQAWVEMSTAMVEAYTQRIARLRAALGLDQH